MDKILSKSLYLAILYELTNEKDIRDFMDTLPSVYLEDLDFLVDMFKIDENVYYLLPKTRNVVYAASRSLVPEFYFSIPVEMTNDCAFMSSLFENDKEVFVVMSDSCKSLEMCIAAVSEDGHFLEYVPESIQNDKKFQMSLSMITARRSNWYRMAKHV